MGRRLRLPSMFSGFCPPVTNSKQTINVDLVPIWGPQWGDQDIPTKTELHKVLDSPKKKKTSGPIQKLSNSS